MQQKKLLLIYVSLSVLSAFGGLYNPWFLTLAAVFAGCSSLIANKMSDRENTNELKAVAVDEELKSVKLELKKITDDLLTVSNRVNMSIGVRK